MRRTGAMRTEHSFVLLLLNGTACLVSGDREGGTWVHYPRGAGIPEVQMYCICVVSL